MYIIYLLVYVKLNTLFYVMERNSIDNMQGEVATYYK